MGLRPEERTIAHYVSVKADVDKLKDVCGKSRQLRNVFNCSYCKATIIIWNFGTTMCHKESWHDHMQLDSDLFATQKAKISLSFHYIPLVNISSYAYTILCRIVYEEDKALRCLQSICWFRQKLGPLRWSISLGPYIQQTGIVTAPAHYCFHLGDLSNVLTMHNKYDRSGDLQLRWLLIIKGGEQKPRNKRRRKKEVIL